MVIKEIRIFFTTPLLELPDAQTTVLQHGWTARHSDTESATYSQTFATEENFDNALDDLKGALGAERYSRIESGTVASESSARRDRPPE